MSAEHDATDRPRIVRKGHLYETDHQTEKAYSAVHAADPYAAAMLFKQWLHDGKIRPDLDAERRAGIGPIVSPPVRQEAHTETITFQGREFRATPDVVSRLDSLDYEIVRRANENAGGLVNDAWADEPKWQYRSTLREGLEQGTLQYVGRVNHRDLTVNGVPGKPWQNAEAEQLEFREQAEAHADNNAPRQGHRR